MMVKRDFVSYNQYKARCSFNSPTMSQYVKQYINIIFARYPKKL